MNPGNRKLLASLVLFSCIAFTQESLPSSGIGEVYQSALIPALRQTGFTFWDNGHLLAYSKNPLSPTSSAVVVYDGAGHVTREVTVWLDGAIEVRLTHATLSKSGKLLVSGGTINGRGVIANFIAEIESDGRVGRVVRTSPFVPAKICSVDDGTVWALGFDRDEHLSSIETAPKLRQFSFEKGQLQAMLDTSRMDPNWLFIDGRYPGEVSFKCNSKEVAIYHAGTGDLVEYDLQEHALRTTRISTLLSVPGQVNFTGFTLTGAGDFFASVIDKSSKPFTSSLLKLKRDGSAQASWVPVASGPYLRGSPIERLIGSEGNDLIFTRAKDSRAYWAKMK